VSKSHWIAGGAVLGVFLWIFAPAIVSSQSFVYRDAAHFHDPLFELANGQWASGHVPLWNPLSGAGAPLAADATSSVFYPGKLIFALPLSYATNYKLYIVGHVLMAAAGAYLLARRWGATVTAAGLCSLSYAFGGNVMFQYCNVVFLVGAAWLPLAVWATDRLLVSRRLAWAPVLGAILAMMILGGDPQSAYHAGLLAAGYALLLWRRRCRKRRRSADRATPRPALLTRLARNRLILLAAAALSGAVLAAIQILPTWEWSRHSERAEYELPRNVYEAVRYEVECRELRRRALRRGIHEDYVSSINGLFGHPEPGTHHEHVYHFSVGPWRLAEYLWPNFSGRQFPVNRRWIDILPAEGRPWTPSLYMGLLPLLLALGSWRLRRGPTRVRWMSWVALLAVLGSFGWYGLGWLAAEVHHAMGGDGDLWIGSPVGGLYWAMTVLLPSYVNFRYPAKLLVIAALALSLLAARGWDRAFAGPAPGLRRALMAVGAISLAGAGGMLLFRPFWQQWMTLAPANELFGPLDAVGAWHDLLRSLLHTALLCSIFWWLFKWHDASATRCNGAPNSRRATPSGSGRRCLPAAIPSLALLVTAMELAIAQTWMVPLAPRQLWDDPSPLTAAIATDRAVRGSDSTGRVYRASPRHWTKKEWKNTSSNDRQREGLQWDHDTLMPNYHLRENLTLVEAHGTLVSREHRKFLHGIYDFDGRGMPAPVVLDMLAAQYLVLPEGVSAPNATEVARLPEGVVLWRNGRAMPRAWIVHEVESMTPLSKWYRGGEWHYFAHALYREGNTRDPRNWAFVETDLDFTAVTAPDGAVVPPIESCRVASIQPQQVEIQANLISPGLVVLSDMFYPGWTAEVETEVAGGETHSQKAPILRTNRIMRGVYLPPGKHRIVYSYRPWSFRVGAVLSLLGWGVLLLGGVVRRTRGKPRR